MIMITKNRILTLTSIPSWPDPSPSKGSKLSVGRSVISLHVLCVSVVVLLLVLLVLVLLVLLLLHVLLQVPEE